jgi:hypothetical protein
MSLDGNSPIACVSVVKLRCTPRIVRAELVEPQWIKRFERDHRDEMTKALAQREGA